MNTGVGTNEAGFVFQLVPSGGQWSLNQLEFYRNGGPHNLVQDGDGNLYGLLPSIGEVFAALNTSSGWIFSEYFITYPAGSLNNLAVNAYGDLYGTGLITGSGLHDPLIYRARFKNYGWYAGSLHYFGYESFPAGGALALDRTALGVTSGNLYGTTSACGSYDAGTAWQLAP